MTHDKPEWYPKAYLAETGGALETDREKIFDPALVQYSRAFRRVPPTYDTAHETAWYAAAREGVLAMLLSVVAASAWRDSLVLMGSSLLRSWLGDLARAPHDLDFAVRPVTVAANDAFAAEQFAAIIAAASVAPVASGAVIAADRIVVDDIWAYDRVPGKRIVFPWHVPGLPNSDSAAQIDFVFGKTLFTEPQETVVTVGVSTHTVLAATPEESLAWKVHHLITDSYPMGKDLYDAVLLGEVVDLPWSLLKSVLMTDEWYRDHGYKQPGITFGFMEWDDFVREYPHVTGTNSEWYSRLLAALAPTFAEREREVAELQGEVTELQHEIAEREREIGETMKTMPNAAPPRTSTPTNGGKGWFIGSDSPASTFPPSENAPPEKGTVSLVRRALGVFHAKITRRKK